MGDFIKTNTARLGQDAETVSGMLQSIRRELNAMKESVAQLDGMWDGPGSEAFKSVFRDDMNAMETVLKNLDSLHAYETNAKAKYEECERKAGGIVAGIRV